MDIDLFNETRNIQFFQNTLRKNFLLLLKQAKKGGFNSYQAWKEAKKWNIDTYADWQIVTELKLQNTEEYELVLQLRKKIFSLLEELFPNQELPIKRIIEITAKD